MSSEASLVLDLHTNNIFYKVVKWYCYTLFGKYQTQTFFKKRELKTLNEKLMNHLVHIYLAF